MGRPALSPKGAESDQAVVYRGSLRSDDGAQFDREFGLDAAGIAPTVTWGTNPEAAAPIKERIPDPVSAPGDAEHDPANRSSRCVRFSPIALRLVQRGAPRSGAATPPGVSGGPTGPTIRSKARAVLSRAPSWESDRRTHKVAFSNLDAATTQNVVGGRVMKKEIR
jgi:homoaconitase/3-isopropylmalate dehydratase large subunit